MRQGAAKTSSALRSSVRDGVSRGFTLVEDVVYVGLGLLLSGAAVVLLVSLVINFWRGLVGGSLPGGVVVVLDQILLILVIVALIASVRRILVLAPELPKVAERGDVQFQNAMIELGVLTIMTLSLVFCLVLLRKRHPDAVAERV